MGAADCRRQAPWRRGQPGQYSKSVIETIATARHRRTRQAVAAFSAVPELRAAHRSLLARWLGADATERNWQSLLKLAGPSDVDRAEELLLLLMEAGVVAIKEEFKNGRWWAVRVVWRDLPGVQRALGLQPVAERREERQALLQQIAAVAEQHPWARSACESCLAASLATEKLRARAQLLQGLCTWQAEQRFGMRQDFSLWARAHTKAITGAEWEWLESHVALESFGIARFEPVLWLGGALTLQAHSGSIDMNALGFLGLPSKGFIAGQNHITRVPLRYWLVENRASFERCALRAEAGTCVIWLPGRPPGDWLAAVQWLISQAPAPADISCDPDPAGIEIALTAGQLWTERGLAWSSTHMAADHWQKGKTLPLNDYDRRVLSSLGARVDLPAEMAALRDFIAREGRKAEQEGWL
jgi:hypothetical protein